MRRLLAALVALLVLVSLPLQGAAAVTTLHCALVHGQVALGMSVGPGFTAHFHRLGEASRHEIGAAAVVAPEPDAGGKAPAEDDGVTCVSCTACCAGTFLVNQPEAPVALPVADEQSFAPAPDPYSGPTPDRLERPPRFLLV